MGTTIAMGTTTNIATAMDTIMTMITPTITMPTSTTIITRKMAASIMGMGSQGFMFRA